MAQTGKWGLKDAEMEVQFFLLSLKAGSLFQADCLRFPLWSRNLQENQFYPKISEMSYSLEVSLYLHCPSSDPKQPFYHFYVAEV